MDQINTSNVKSLVPRWLFQHGVIDGVSNQTTPIIVDGVMYVTDSRGSVYAVDASDGHHLWTYDVSNLIGGGAREGYVFRNRGVSYADGVIYTAAGSFLFALDAKSGKPIQTFGKDGQASVILDVLGADTGGEDRHQSRILVHDRATGVQRACSTSAARSESTFPAVMCWRSMPKPAR
jgi:glucose dehydrogenase